MCRERGQILDALTQRGQAHLDDGDAVVEVGAEAPGGDLGAQILVGRADDARVDRDGRARADGHDLALLQHAEELHLHRGRRLAELVEEDGAAARRDEQAVAIAHRPGERAAHVAEELRLEQRVGERAAIDGDERPGLARAVEMNRARDELLARAALALDEHGRLRRGDAIEPREHGLHRGPVADEVRVVVASLERGLLLAHLLGEPADRRGLPFEERLDARALDVELGGAPRELGVQARVRERDRDLIREREQHVDGAVVEEIAAEAVVDIERADDALGRADRHAEHRFQPHRVDRRVACEALVALGVEGHDRRAGRDDARGDAPRERHVARASGRRIGVARRGDLELGGARVVERRLRLAAREREQAAREQHEAALGVGELERVIDREAEDRRDLERRAELLVHVDEPLEPLGAPLGGDMARPLGRRAPADAQRVTPVRSEDVGGQIDGGALPQILCDRRVAARAHVGAQRVERVGA